MLVNGTGITQFDIKVLPGFRPMTKLAIKWKKLESGNFVGVDRGSSQDVYETAIQTWGTESYVNNIINQFNNRRTNSDQWDVTLSDFESTEKIFGENVDHSGSISAVIDAVSARKNSSLNGFVVDIKIRASSPSFTGSSSFPTLDCCDIGYTGDSQFTIKNQYSYDATTYYNDKKQDVGVFEGIFTVSRSDMILLRNYIRTQRTGDFILQDTFGIDYPFGIYSPNSYNFYTKLIEWSDLGYFGLQYSKIRLKFAEYVS